MERREDQLLSLEEVGGSSSGRYDPLRVGDGAEQLGLSSVDVLEDHDGCDVSAAVAVVGSRPHGHKLLIKHELVAFVNQLMCAADELQIVDVHKLIGNLGAKQPAGTSRTDRPGVHILWIGPHEITERPLVGNLLVAFDGADLVQRLDVR